MKRATQSETNPFRYSDSNKRYHTFDYWLKTTYGGKCAVVPLDAGFTCPNIDGRKGSGGCIYCSGRGSGDFACPPTLPIAEQYRLYVDRIGSKWNCVGFFPYLQAHTNTYAPRDRLAEVFSVLPGLPCAKGVHIATRADCLGDGVTDLLSSLSDRTDLTVELGLQTVFDETAERINRCHSFADFCDGFSLLRREVPKARICVHLIDGLPGETRDMMVESARRLGAMGVDEIKIHLLYVLRGTKLAALYESGAYIPMEESDYCETVVDQLEVIPAECVIGRLTGDGAPDALIAPLWSKKKLNVINRIDRIFFERNSFQGIKVPE